MVVPEHEHVRGEPDLRRAGGEEAKGAERIPVRPAAPEGLGMWNSEVLAAGQVVVAQRVGRLGDAGDVLNGCRSPPSAAWAPGIIVNTGVSTASRSSNRRSSEHVPAGIHHDRLPGHHATLVAGQEQGCVGHVQWLRDVSQRHAGEELGPTGLEVDLVLGRRPANPVGPTAPFRCLPARGSCSGFPSDRPRERPTW